MLVAHIPLRKLAKLAKQVETACRVPHPFFCGDRGTYALSATSHMHTLSPESQRHDNPYGRKETRSADGADSHVKFCQSRSECWSDGTKCPFCAAKVIRNLSLVQTFEFPPKTRVMKQATTVMSYRGTTTSVTMFSEVRNNVFRHPSTGTRGVDAWKTFQSAPFRSSKSDS